MIELSKEEGDKWKAAVAPVIEEYAVDADKKGLPGKELVELHKEVFGEI